MELPKWLPGNWSLPSLFSFQPQVDGQSSGSAPPPEHRRQPSRRDDESDSNKSTRREPPKKPFEPPQPQRPHLPDTIHQLLVNPALYDPLRAPRFPIVLCHGEFGFGVLSWSIRANLRLQACTDLTRVVHRLSPVCACITGRTSFASCGVKLVPKSSLHQFPGWSASFLPVCSF